MVSAGKGATLQGGTPLHPKSTAVLRNDLALAFNNHICALNNVDIICTATAGDFMPAQIQGAVDFDVERSCSLNILQQRNGRAIVFRFERIVQIAHIGGRAVLLHLRNGGGQGL